MEATWLIGMQAKQRVDTINRSLAYRKEGTVRCTIREMRCMYDQLLGMLYAYHVAATGNTPTLRYGAHLAAKELGINLAELSDRIETAPTGRRRKVNAT